MSNNPDAIRIDAHEVPDYIGIHKLTLAEKDVLAINLSDPAIQTLMATKLGNRVACSGLSISTDYALKRIAKLLAGLSDGPTADAKPFEEFLYALITRPGDIECSAP